MNDRAIAASRLPVDAPELSTIYETIAVGSAERDAKRAHPFDVLAELRRVRFGALHLPANEGGWGRTLRDVIQEAIKLGAADTNVAHIFRNHFTFVERFLVGNADPGRERWRAVVLAGGIAGLATTELDRPQTGGAYPFKASLTPDGDGYRLKGTKYYSTGSLYADLIQTRATTPEGLTATVILPAQRDGIELIDDWDGIGQRVTGTGTTNFHDVRVEASEIVLERDNPTYLLPYISTIAQLFVTAAVAGTVLAALRDAKTLLHSRARNFYYALNETPSADPLLQEVVGRISADAFAAELVVLGAAEKLQRVADSRRTGQGLDDLAHDAAVAAAKAKIIADELALRSTTALFDVGGASAATERKNLDRHWRNARTLASHNPANYKALGVGAWELHGTRLPRLGFF